jgi:WD40 repeat protein
VCLPALFVTSPKSGDDDDEPKKQMKLHVLDASSIWEWSTKLIRQQEDAERGKNEDEPFYQSGTPVICKSQEAKIEEWDEEGKEYKVKLLKDNVTKRVPAFEITPFVPFEPALNRNQHAELDKRRDVKKICSSSDGSTVAVFVDESIIVYNKEMTATMTLDVSEQCGGFYMSGDGRIIVVLQENDDDYEYTDVQVHSIASNGCKVLPKIKHAYAMAISHNGQLFAVGTTENFAHIFEIEGHEDDNGRVPLLKTFTFGDWTTCVGFSKNCEWFVASGCDLTARIWSLAHLSQDAYATFSFTETPEFVNLSDDGSLLVSGEDSAIKVWDISTKTEVCVSTKSTRDAH